MSWRFLNFKNPRDISSHSNNPKEVCQLAGDMLMESTYDYLSLDPNAQVPAHNISDRNSYGNNGTGQYPGDSKTEFDPATGGYRLKIKVSRPAEKRFMGEMFESLKNTAMTGVLDDIVLMHPWASSEQSYTQINFSPQFNEIVYVRQDKDGNLFWSSPTNLNPQDLNTNMGGQNIPLGDQNLPWSPGTNQPRISEGEQPPPGKVSFTWNELKEMAGTGVFEPILEHIRGHECSAGGCATKWFGGDQYTAFNLYASTPPSACGAGCKMGNVSYLQGKKLTDFTIGEIMNYQSSGARLGTSGARLFASGGYQIIPKTMKSAFEKIRGINNQDLFSKDNQDALGIYLVTMKRQTLGKYLLGYGGIDAANAGNQLALEFASVVLQKAMKKKGRTIPAGFKYYGGDGANSSGNGDPGGVERAKTMNAINSARDRVMNSAVVQDILLSQQESSTADTSVS
tara:strand:- start:4442 stop:5803 length:1362 start_codon:yes stop_codon:yes gene_type:complete